MTTGVETWKRDDTGGRLHGREEERSGQTEVGGSGVGVECQGLGSPENSDVTWDGVGEGLVKVGDGRDNTVNRTFRNWGLIGLLRESVPRTSVEI